MRDLDRRSDTQHHSVAHVSVFAAGLDDPRSLTLGVDGYLYMSTFGFGSSPGVGQVIRIDIDR